jgi:hypothetical protein
VATYPPQAQTYDDDPLSGESVPSLSFKDAPVGTLYTGIITKRARLLQQRDFESGQLANWEDGNPKMAAVIELDVMGDTFALWAPKPSAMFAALVAAQKAAEAGTMVEGGELSIEFIGTEPNKKNPRLNAQKLYRCHYVPPTPQDPLQHEAPAAPPQPAQPSRPPRPMPAQPPRPAPAPQAQAPQRPPVSTGRARF